MRATQLRNPKEFHDRLKEQMEYPPREWVFDDALYSVHDLRDEPWAVGTVETFEGAKWARSTDPDRRRLFVWLLNDCLRTFAAKIGMRYSKDDDALFDKATPNLSPRVKRNQGRQQWAFRHVFREHRSKTDAT